MFYLERDKKKILKDFLFQNLNSNDLMKDDFLDFLKNQIENFQNYIQPDLYFYSEENNKCFIIDFLPFVYKSSETEIENSLQRLKNSILHKEKNFNKYFTRIQKKLGKKVIEFSVILVIEDFSNTKVQRAAVYPFSDNILNTALKYSTANHLFYKALNSSAYMKNTQNS